jgi:uncharacterized protein DUF6602
LNQKRDFFLALLDHFQDCANTLASEARGDRIFPNTSDSGSERENDLFKFLNNHIPFRCKVIKGGFIFDSNGNESDQIDLIITNDLTLQFRKSENDKEKSFNCIEGCYAAISVKSYLNKEGLIKSVDNLRSIPTEKKIKVNPYITNPQQLIDLTPQRIIFAYDGDSLETINGHLYDYYSTHHLDRRAPDMIIVNNSFYIFRAGAEGVKLPTGEYIPPNIYAKIGKIQNANIGAASLIQMIARIQTVSIPSPYMEIDFNEYLKKLDETVVGFKGKNP